MDEKGFVELVDYMPKDLADVERRIVEAARTSSGDTRMAEKLSGADRALIGFLYANEHFTPFEMVQLQFRIKCPLFIARQWMRHRTGSFNEYSGRYSVLEDEFYHPNHARMQDAINRQMSSDVEPDAETDAAFHSYLEKSRALYDDYEDLISRGVAKEVARIGLGVNIYTRFIWSVNLRNFLHFIKLRIAPDAQPEIRVYAEELYAIVRKLCPNTCAAFEDNELNSLKFSAKELQYISENYDISITPKNTSTNTAKLGKTAIAKLPTKLITFEGWSC